MPQVFKIGSYWVYFWSNENEPLEPIHVHVSEGAPNANGTKIWITKSGKCYLCHNNSQIPNKEAVICQKQVAVFLCDKLPKNQVLYSKMSLHYHVLYPPAPALKWYCKEEKKKTLSK